MTTTTRAAVSPASIASRMACRLDPRPEIKMPIGSFSLGRSLTASRPFENQLVHFELHGYRVLSCETGQAEDFSGQGHTTNQTAETEVAEAVGPDVLRDLWHTLLRGDQLGPARHVHTEVTRIRNGRGAAAKMNLFD